MYRNTHPVLLVLFLLAALTCAREASAQGLPGVQLTLAAGEESRLVVGEVESPCLAWTWKPSTSTDPPPGDDAMIYPGPKAGTLGKVDSTWTLDAQGTVISPAACVAGGVTTPLPELGLGPLGELWLLDAPNSPTEGNAAAWAKWMHTVEAAYRQSGAGPADAEQADEGQATDGMAQTLNERTIGRLGDCEIRSFPVDTQAPQNHWSPIELSEAVSVRRFFWWVEPSCFKAGSATPPALRLFPIPGSDESGASYHLLTVNQIALGSAPSQLSYSELAPDSWTPRVRAKALAPDSDVLNLPLTLDLQNPPSDLCLMPGLAEACRRSSRARHQIFTVVDRQDADRPWPAARRDAAQNLCRTTLKSHAAEDACSESASWHQRLAGELVAVFDEDIVLSESPQILEKWQNNGVVWQVDDPAALAAGGEVQIELLGGGRVLLQPQPINAPAASRAANRTPSWISWLTASLAGLATILAAIALLRTFGTKKDSSSASRRELLLLIERALDRRLPKVLPKLASSGNVASDHQALDSAVRDGLRGLEERMAEVERRLNDHIGPSRPTAAGPAETSISEAVVSDTVVSDTVVSDTVVSDTVVPENILSEPTTKISQGDLQALCRDIVDLDKQQDGRVTDALRAAGDLGYWIEILWPALQEAAGVTVDSIAGGLPEAAAAEWNDARETLESFAAHDAPALRWLVRRLDGGEAGPSTELVFLENSGLLHSGTTVLERLKRYLVPFDVLGRLGEITLALQYLVEAYPIEQLKPTQQTRLAQGLAEAVQSMRLVENFHQLVARVATGVGLDYRPVPYYKSRLDQSEHAFVRQQVSPVSLSERVGFDAKTDPSVIVRLDRPFFVQSANQVYYCGHAHVARD